MPKLHIFTHSNNPDVSRLAFLFEFLRHMLYNIIIHCYKLKKYYYFAVDFARRTLLIANIEL